MLPLTRSLLRHGHAIARETGARAVLLYADVLGNENDVADLLADVAFRVILVTKRDELALPREWEELCEIVRVPRIPLTRAGQIKIATLVAAAEGLIRRDDRIVCMTGIEGSGAIDTILVVDLGAEAELFGMSSIEPLPPDVEASVFERLLTIASELGLEGREGKPVGALFVLGDSDRVLAESRQLVINPFHGYPHDERNVLDGRLEETIKEFSAIDGAFVVKGDGVVLSAGRYLAPAIASRDQLPKGLGTRHEAAAAITLTTDSVAISISQSTGTVSIFRRGKLMTDIAKPRSRLAHDSL